MQTVPSVTDEFLVGADVSVLRADGQRCNYADLDAAATSSASLRVVQAVQDFLPWYSSAHRGAGTKSRITTSRYECAREQIAHFVGADPGRHSVVFTRNTTEALNVLAFRLGLRRDEVVLTTVVEHHANLLPWRRHARLRTVDVDADGTFSVEAVISALDEKPTPRVLAITGASNVTGWLPDLAAIVAAARRRGVFIAVDAAQLAPHRPINMTALGVDAVALSGHKMYAPFGAGALIAPSTLLAGGEPLLVGGGAVKAVSFDDVVWADGPDRDEAGSPNTIGAIALAVAADELAGSWPTLLAHERALSELLDAELAAVPGLHRYGPASGPDRLPVAAFNLPDVPHDLLAARLNAEYGIGVRSGCFCAHPYMARLLSLTEQQVRQFHSDVTAAPRHHLPGAVRASANRATTAEHVSRLGSALQAIAADPNGADNYELDAHGGYVRRDC